MGTDNASSGKKETIVDNEVDNILMPLANRLQALSVYDEYERDRQANDLIWRELRAR